MYKWCAKCLKGEGLWTKSSRDHHTSEHRDRKDKGKGGAKKEAGYLAKLGNAPLEVHFNEANTIQMVGKCHQHLPIFNLLS